MPDKLDDLLSLKSYVDVTLDATDKVRKILQIECDEANFILRPWIVESVITRDVDENYCTCISEGNIQEQAEEIAIGIDKALAQAQKLRQKVARNVSEEKRRNETIDVQKIYALPSTSKKVLQNTEQKKLPHSSSDSSTAITKSKSKSKSPKNFIAANKSSVKAISKRNAQITKKQKSHASNEEILARKKSIPSVTELDSLIKKVSLNMMIKETSSTAVSSKNDCPCHGDNITKTVIERKQTTLDVVDGLEQFGIPKNLLSILKVYHSYVGDSTKEYLNARDRPSVKKFLNNFERANDKRGATFKSNDLVTLLHEFPKLYQGLHEKNLNSVALSEMKTKYNELDKLSKKCGIKKYDTLKAKRSGVNLNLNNECISRGWLSNGIWNWTSLSHFSYFTNAPYIQYTNKNQLLSLFDTSQRLQQTIYRSNLLDILLHEIIPMMKNKLDPSTEEYVEMYKMIFIIAQIINPKLPVLVNTEE